MRPRLVLVGNPENRRIQGFMAEARALGLEPTVLAYADLLGSTRALRDLPDRPSLVRLESYGENFELTRRFLGEPRLAEDHGRIDRPAAVHRGYLRLLGRLERVFDARPRWDVRPSPPDVRILFDKRRLSSLYRRSGIPVPESIRAGSYEAIRELSARRGWHEVYVKLRSGSSASGLGLLRWGGPRVEFLTTVEEDRRRYYNSLRLRLYRREAQVARIVDFLSSEGVHVERAIPKASFEGSVFDFRVLCVAGDVPFAVARLSRSPLTNLHLGNRRGDLEAVRRSLPGETWEGIVESAKRAFALHRCLHLGVDVAVHRDRRRHYVLEANAFGDLLPGLVHRGRSVYRYELERWLAR